MGILSSIPKDKWANSSVFDFKVLSDECVDVFHPEYRFLILCDVITREGRSKIPVRVKSNGDILELPKFYMDYCHRMNIPVPRNLFNYRYVWSFIGDDD